MRMKKFIYSVVFVLLIVSIFGCTEKVKEGNKKNEDKTQTSEKAKPTTGEFKVTSSAFKDGGEIPVKYTVDMKNGKNISIPLKWENAPEGTKSFAITMIDKSADNFLHWMVVNIGSSESEINEGASGKNMPSMAEEIKNDYEKEGYGGPGPPPGEQHEYEITVRALSVDKAGITRDSGLKEFEAGIEGKVLDKALITGKFGQ